MLEDEGPREVLCGEAQGNPIGLLTSMDLMSGTTVWGIDCLENDRNTNEMFSILRSGAYKADDSRNQMARAFLKRYRSHRAQILVDRVENDKAREPSEQSRPFHLNRRFHRFSNFDHDFEASARFVKRSQ